MENRCLRIEFNKNQIRLAFCALFLCVSAREIASESLTLSTTYPAPFGVYNQIITTGNGGPAPVNTTLNKNAGNTILVPPTNGAGRVGIGTTSPVAKLDVVGSIRMANGNQGVGKALISDATGVANWTGFKTEVYTTLFHSVIGQSFTCPVAGHLIVSCSTVEAPAGDSTCITAINGATCLLGGCIAPPGQNFASQIVCAGF